jgi:putative ABC transport system permease protein
MIFTENVREAMKAIRDNLLRTSLTAAIIAIGITALVGILTAIDAIQNSVSQGLSDLGANTFTISDLDRRRRQQMGVNATQREPISYEEITAFKRKFEELAPVALQTSLSGTAEIKSGSQKTNPNISVNGADEHYLATVGGDLEFGRSFSSVELRNGAPVAIIGYEVAETLFKNAEKAVNQPITLLGNQFRVIGVLKNKGGFGGGGGGLNRNVLIPFEKAVSLANGRRLYYRATCIVRNPRDLEYLMGEATGKFRLIRRDALGKPESFLIEKNETAQEALEKISGQLRIGGFGIGFITLLGASIGLMNIMLVSVTERTREIGIRKAIGATPTRIREQFLIEAIVICIIGGLVGIILGILIGNLVAVLVEAGGFLVPWAWMTVALFVCIGVGILSGYYPAFKASKLDPIESLRFE